MMLTPFELNAIYFDMEEKTSLRQEVERIALVLGARPTDINNWRYRKIPAEWRMKILSHAAGKISWKDMEAFEKPYPIRAKKKENAS